MPDIKDTLLQKLFVTHPGNPIYERYISQIFPDRELFVEFLREREHERLVDLAERILARLSHDSSVYPAYSLLLNLHHAEYQLTIDRARADFIGRDHFVHLVSLYLLGIYAFFYNSKLQRMVLRPFLDGHSHDMRFEKKGARAEAAHRDFFDCWRLFVLFHDLGYPWEAPRSLNNRQEVYLRPFRRLKSLYAREVALRHLSQLICLRQLLQGRPRSKLHRDLRAFMPGIEAQKEKGQQEFPLPTGRYAYERIKPLSKDNVGNIVAQYGEYERLSPIHGGTLYACVNSAFLCEQLLAVCEDVENETLVAIILPSVAGQGRIVCASADTSGRRALGYDQLLQYAFSSYTPLGNTPLKWTYYSAKPAEEFAQFILGLMDGDKKLAEHFTQAASHLSATAPIKYSMMNSDEELRDYLFFVYCNIVDPDADDQNPTLAEQDIRRKALGEIGPSLAAEVSAVIKQKLTVASRSRQAARIDSSSFAIVVRNLLDTLRDTDALAKEVLGSLDAKIERTYAARVSIRKVYNHLTTKVGRQSAGETHFRAEYVDSGESEGGAERTVLDSKASVPLAKIVEDRLKHLGLDDLNLLKEYRPEFGKKIKDFLDHGVASAFLLMDCCSLICGIDANALRRSPDKTQAFLQKHKLNTVVAEAALAILVHNLYPESLSNRLKQYRTDIAHHPFGYFAILCDSLQPWDRKRLCTIRERLRPYSTYSATFNIEVRNDLFYVSEGADGLSIGKRFDALKGHLDDYLKNASHLLKVQLGEYKT